MDILLQDVAVTTVAIGAALVLAQRLRSVFAPRGKNAACDACPGCESSAVTKK